MDSEFLWHNDSYPNWMRNLPQDLQVVFEGNELSQPWIPSPFVGNLHCYQYLTVIMHHRPQINYLMENDTEISWKPSMMICMEAAKKMFCILEGMLQEYGIYGLLCMQQGMSFHIYFILNCTMLHLI
jgi:hypothetical protein